MPWKSFHKKDVRNIYLINTITKRTVITIEYVFIAILDLNDKMFADKLVNISDIGATGDAVAVN
ncbi:MAG: hypothetical protein Kapaf2KO_10260 [Candidatus Kapaibacteriales bacterium]